MNNLCISKKNTNDANEIVPNLWLGNDIAAHNKKFVDDNNIKYIINLTVNTLNVFPHIKYMQFHIRDQDTCAKDISDIYDMSLNLIIKALKEKVGILVHCEKGNYKSGNIVTAFIIKYLRLNYFQALVYVNNIRPCSVQKNTCMSHGLFTYYLRLNNILCNNKECPSLNK